MRTTSYNSTTSQGYYDRKSSINKNKLSCIEILIEESLIDTTWTNPLLENLLTEKEIFNPENGLRSDGDPKRFRYKLVTTPMAGLIQWVKLPPSTNPSNWSYTDYQSYLQPISAVVINNEDFSNRAFQSVDDISFPSLDQYITTLLTKIKQYSSNPLSETIPKVTLLFIGLEKFSNKIQKKVCVSYMIIIFLIFHALYKHYYYYCYYAHSLPNNHHIVLLHKYLIKHVFI